jgi:hypothetical protein
MRVENGEGVESGKDIIGGDAQQVADYQIDARYLPCGESVCVLSDGRFHNVESWGRIGVGRLRK